MAFLELGGTEERDDAVVGDRRHCGQIVECSDNVRGRVIAMEGRERHGALVDEPIPFVLAPEHAVGDFAQLAVGSAQTSAEPVAHLSRQRAVGVVDADE